MTAAVLAAVVFIVDLNVPFDIAVSALYGLVVLIGLYMRDHRFPWITGSIVLKTSSCVT